MSSKRYYMRLALPCFKVSLNITIASGIKALIKYTKHVKMHKPRHTIRQYKRRHSWSCSLLFRSLRGIYQCILHVRKLANAVVCVPAIIRLPGTRKNHGSQDRASDSKRKPNYAPSDGWRRSLAAIPTETVTQSIPNPKTTSANLLVYARERQRRRDNILSPSSLFSLPSGKQKNTSLNSQSSALKKKERKRWIRSLFDRCNFADYAYLYDSLPCLSVLYSFAVSRLCPRRRRGATIPPGSTLFYPRLDVKWVAARSMGTTGTNGGATRGCGGTLWELSVVLSTGVAWMCERTSERVDARRTGLGGIDASSPLRIPHFAAHRTGANVKRFRDVKTDTRVAHFGPSTSFGYGEVHVSPQVPCVITSSISI